MTEARSLSAIVERFLGVDPEERAAVFREMTVAFRAALDSGDREAVSALLPRVILPDLDYTSVTSLVRLHRRLCDGAPPAPSGGGRAVPMAVLGSFTTTQLTPMLALYLFAAGVRAEIYESEFGIFRQEILEAESGLYRHAPRLVFLATGWRDLLHRPSYGEDAGRVAGRVREEVDGWNRLWEALHRRLACQILQNNFEQPPWRALDNHEMRYPAARGRYIAQVNQALLEQAPPYVTIHDIDHLAACVGRWRWSDPRFHFEAKLPCAPECLPRYAHQAASVLAASLGGSRKCLVLDLDNTLWGGVVGDDGIAGLRLGQGSAEGEAFLAFQHYVSALQRRGVILAVCSKNEERTARQVFDEHPEMVLRPADISCFVANWDDKATNLRRIARELNIGLNALVFVDDTPAERAWVRRTLPEVAVPEMPADPGLFIQALEQGRYFQTVSIEEEDLRRTAYYRADGERKRSEADATDLDAFLRSLEMRARIASLDAMSLPRAAQLINKSNQFNLTTRRYSQADLMAFASRPDWIARVVSLTDRFGDNGWISVLLGQIEGNAVRIDTWVMSCRVLKRGVEQLLLSHLCEAARSRGLTRLRGEYIPTAKNGLVRDHYASLGFTRLDPPAANEGITRWELALDAPRTHARTWIQEETLA